MKITCVNCGDEYFNEELQIVELCPTCEDERQQIEVNELLACQYQYPIGTSRDEP